MSSPGASGVLGWRPNTRVKGRLVDREEFGLVAKEMKGSQERPSV